MARIVGGPRVSGQVTSRETGAPLGGVTVNVNQTVYTDPEFTAGVTAVTTAGDGSFSFYAPPGNYTFTTSAGNANPIESVEVLGQEEGTGTHVGGASSWIDVTKYGAVADNGATDNTAAFAAAVAACQAAGGGTIYFPPNAASYKGTLTLTGNYRISVVGYGAVLLAPDSGVGVDLSTGNGGSALGCVVSGLHVKGSVNMNATGVRISDCDRTRLREMSFERLAVGVQLRTTTGPNGCEANTLRDSEINNCTIGIDFQPNTGTGGSGHFDETFVQNVNINNCPTGVNLATGGIFVRAEFDDVTCWVPTNGTAFYTDVDMTRVRARLAGEAYSGATGCIGFRVGVNFANSALSEVVLQFQGSIGTKIDNTAANNGTVVIWREGNIWYHQSKSTATSLAEGPSVRQSTDTQSRIGFGMFSPSNAPFPGGRYGLFFGPGGSTAPDTVMYRPAAHVLQLGFTDVFTPGSAATGSRPAAAIASQGGPIFYDTTIKRLIVSDGTNWRVTKSLLQATQTLATSGAVTIDTAAGSSTVTTLQANATSSSITNAFTGAQLTIAWKQDATGGRTYAWPTNCRFAAGSAPSDTTLNTETSVTFEYDGALWKERARAVAVPTT